MTLVLEGHKEPAVAQAVWPVWRREPPWRSDSFGREARARVLCGRGAPHLRRLPLRRTVLRLPVLEPLLRPPPQGLLPQGLFSGNSLSGGCYSKPLLRLLPRRPFRRQASLRLPPRPRPPQHSSSWAVTISSLLSELFFLVAIHSPATLKQKRLARTGQQRQPRFYQMALYPRSVHAQRPEPGQGRMNSLPSPRRAKPEPRRLRAVINGRDRLAGCLVHFENVLWVGVEVGVSHAVNVWL